MNTEIAFADSIIRQHPSLGWSLGRWTYSGSSVEPSAVRRLIIDAVRAAHADRPSALTRRLSSLRGVEAVETLLKAMVSA